MRPLRLEEIAGLEAYAEVRDAYRRELIAYKQARRMAVGEQVTLLFEDRETLRFQVQEMLRVEQIDAPERVQHELDVYNQLMPGERELSATLFVEIQEASRIREELDRLIGIDEHVALRLGRGGDVRRVRAHFDPKQMEEERISAVQYIRFALDAEDADRLADARVPAAVEIDHPRYAREAVLPGALRAGLVAGLRADPAPLLPDSALRARAPERVLFEVGGLRVLARGSDPLELAVVPAAARTAADWLAGTPAFGAELEEALRRASAEVIARAGAARIELRVAADGAPLGWRVVASPRR
jgi:hypothetical protein